ncbi:lytic transglycosylase domain-containing protein [Nocardia sp. alder85J]|uniref:lytic transglycosylase domain-containing protein n=1 Tax=Nocardia sp. alder85J TaxID=2862949 RepID=UPI001CD6FE62|nr:lytic murein transglycosylase [Nocardia sp. alder85J]MCX4096182.1 lytic murein transglycosylase [Nocardia sp. alder85J]
MRPVLARRRASPSVLARAVFPGVVAVLVAALVALSGCAASNLPPIPDGIPPGPGTPVPAIDLDAPGRTAEQLHGWAESQSGTLGIPVVALEAYGYAAAVMARSRPGCGIGWTTLAGIAAVESKHGSHGGSRLDADGTVRPPIRGVPLDGSPGVARIVDEAATARAGSPVYVRAMGPFQFLPETWQHWGVDANGDGTADPDNIDDAALTAARYLCASGGDLTTADGWQRALMTYNQSTAYMARVRTHAAAYSVGRRA